MRIGATFDAQASFFDLMSGGEEKVVPQADTSFCPRRQGLPRPSRAEALGDAEGASLDARFSGWASDFDQMPLKGETNRFGTVGDVEAHEDFGKLLLDRNQGNVQLGGDLLIREASGGEFELL